MCGRRVALRRDTKRWRREGRVAVCTHTSQFSCTRSDFYVRGGEAVYGRQDRDKRKRRGQRVGPWRIMRRRRTTAIVLQHAHRSSGSCRAMGAIEPYWIDRPTDKAKKETARQCAADRGTIEAAAAVGSYAFSLDVRPRAVCGNGSMHSRTQVDTIIV